MDLTGLLSSIYESVINIDAGRKGFANKGKAEEGRISYETGISEAMTVFKEAQATADPEIIILSEYTFITQELQFCEKTDKDAINSLTRGIRFFDDAFLALETVQSSHYDIAEKTFPHDAKYRVKGFPMDSFHIACKGHKGRLQNILKTPGLDPIEKALLKQRLDTLAAGQEGYGELQRKALKGDNSMLKLIRDFNDTEIKTAIENAKDGFFKYNDIMEMFSNKKINVSEDTSFQEKYKNFYGMNLVCGDDFLANYFNFLEEHKNDDPKPTFTNTLAYFYNSQWPRRNGKIEYEFSFVSKLLATLDPELPVWDSNVRAVLGFKNPTGGNKIEEAGVLYEELKKWYKKHLSSEECDKWKDFFDKEYPNSKLTSTKKIDFILWQLGAKIKKEKKNKNGKTNT